MQPQTHFKTYEKIILAGLGLACAFVIGMFVYVRWYSSDYIEYSLENVPPVPVAIVLGAAVASGGPTLVLSDRITTAVSLYESHKVEKIMVSGDDTKRGYREAAPMKKALIEKGVPEESIIVDPNGIDTYSTMYNARYIYNISQAVVVTQNFHLPRAIFLARSLGIDAYGISADKREYTLRNSFREIFANIKAFLDLTFPEYHGSIGG